MKSKIQRWWMCDFMGGMADPINCGVFISCLIGALFGIILAISFLGCTVVHQGETTYYLPGIWTD